MSMDEQTQGQWRAGFACLVGRPNAGKSTLTNALVGDKVAITSSKPQTTRHTIRGIHNTDDSQLVLVDTPGLHKPRTLLGERLNDLVTVEWERLNHLRSSTFSFVPERARASVNEHHHILHLIETHAPADAVERAVRQHRAATLARAGR